MLDHDFALEEMAARYQSETELCSLERERWVELQERVRRERRFMNAALGLSIAFQLAVALWRLLQGPPACP